tara:strand:+ start:1667 stop:2794 length:1128 start_codon:yes stop_codon:yes gene_type:complete
MKNTFFSVGLEEEYLVVNKYNGELIVEPPKGLMRDCKKKLGNQVKPEFLKSQIEVGTKICKSIKDLKNNLIFLRRSIAKILDKYDLAFIAVSTHPFSGWETQKHTEKRRYFNLADKFQIVGRRLVISGMHIHVGIPDNELRIDLMNQISYFLPHLLALSTSSPFWKGELTGLKSYRVSIFDELPRTGLPELFDSYDEYKRHVKILLKSGLLDDPSTIWWDLRPNVKFPTLEMRICDTCTSLNDAISIAALYLSVIHMACRLRRENKRWRIYSRMLISENRWRAQRYGIEKNLVDFGKSQLVSYEKLLDELIDLVRNDAKELNCMNELKKIKNICKVGTSADKQIKIYKEEIKKTNNKKEALEKVLKFLIKETVNF